MRSEKTNLSSGLLVKRDAGQNGRKMGRPVKTGQVAKSTSGRIRFDRSYKPIQIHSESGFGFTGKSNSLDS